MRRSALLRYLRIFLLIPAVLLTSSDHAKSVTAQNDPTQTLYALYWSVESEFTSTLELKNNIMARGLTVHTSLYFANGEEQYLSALELGPRETVVLDLNRVLGPQSNPGRREGSLKVWFESKSASAVMGSTTVTNSEKGIAWNFFLYPTNPGLPIAPVGGVFWFQDSQTDGFVPVHNGSAEFMTVVPRFHVEGQVYPLPPTSIAPGRFYKLELRKELRRLGVTNVAAGGLSFVYEGVPDALRAHGVLYNNKGFSAEIDFNRMDDWDEPQELALRTPRLAIGAAAPELGLPPRTSFKPVLALHNFNSYTMNLTLNVGYRVGGNPTEMGIPVSLASGQTRVLELHPYLQDVVAAGAPWASLEISYTSRHDGLAASLVSVSEDGNHSIRSVMNWVQAVTREGWVWRVDENYNTLLGIFNSTAEDARATLSLDYYVEGNRHSYDIPDLLIPARASELIDLGRLIASGTPDAEGDVIPSGVAFGGYRLKKTAPNIIGNLTTEALIINRRTRTFLTIYNTGCCWMPAQFYPSSFGGIPGQGFQLEIWSEDTCTGQPEQLTEIGQYWTSDLNVAEMDPIYTGTVRLTGPGSTGASSELNYIKYDYISGCRRRIDYAGCTVTVKPVIAGLNTVWWFGGQTPSGYATNVTLTASQSNATYEWSVTAGAHKINLADTSGNQAQVSATGQGIGSQANDVSITVTVNGQTSAPFNITVRTPHRAVPLIPPGQSSHITHDPDSSYGYQTTIRYRILDNLDALLPTPIWVNECWTSDPVKDYAGEVNWLQSQQQGAEVPNSAFEDQIQGYLLSIANPVPTSPQSPLGNVKVQHWGQAIYIGSSTACQGRRIQTNTFQKYIDHATHENVISPNP